MFAPVLAATTHETPVMKLTTPKKPVFLISAALAALAVVLFLVPTLIAGLSPHVFWILLIAYAILLLGNLLRDF